MQARENPWLSFALSYECYVAANSAYVPGTTSSTSAHAIAHAQLRGEKFARQQVRRDKRDDRDSREAKRAARDAGWEHHGGRWVRRVSLFPFYGGEAVRIVGEHPHAGCAGVVTGRSIQPAGVGARMWEVRLDAPVEIDGVEVESVYAEPAKLERIASPCDIQN